MKIEFSVESTLKRTPRVMQLEGSFDVPAQEKLARTWSGEAPIEDKPWNIGAIVGPSGSGKTQIMRQMFGEPAGFEWTAGSVIDDFPKGLPIAEITGACSAVGFNTVPSWMKAFAVLSNGEKFRVELARALLEGGDPIVVDEFTSVVDRQVAQIGSHAVQKFVRTKKAKFVAVTCHYDVIDWLQPDWILEPSTMAFQWRSLRRRPDIDVEICRVEYAAWSIFAPFHYMTAELNKSAKCFALFVGDTMASFAAVLPRPHPKVKDVYGVSRLVTLPDFQGLGLAMVLSDRLGACYRALGADLHTYPAHPSLIRSFDHSENWTLTKKPGFSNRQSKSTTVGGGFGGRPNAVFSYIGQRSSREDASGLIG